MWYYKRSSWPNCQWKKHSNPFQAFIILIDSIVEYTNKKIRTVKLNLPANTKPNPYIKETEIVEIGAFLGLFLYRGLYKQNTMGTNKLFSDKYGPPIYGAVMPNDFVEKVDKAI